MAVTEGRFNSLEKRVNDFAERLAKVEGGSGTSQSKQSGWVAWLPIGAPIATLIVVIVTVGIHLDNKIGTTQKDLQTIKERMGKVEDAVKVLTNQQSDQTQKLIHDLLSAAKIATKPEIAVRATETAGSLTAILQKEKRSAPPEFFQSVIQEIDALSQQNGQPLKDVVFRTQKQLAEYRSTIQPQQTIGSTIICTPNFNGESLTMGRRLMSNLTLMNCPQVLDGIGWKNIVFLGSHIIYRGGPLILENVIFVNCTFEVQQNNDGQSLLQYVALDKKALNIQSKAIPLSNPSGL